VLAACILPDQSSALPGPAVINITDKVISVKKAGRLTITQAQLLVRTKQIGNSATLCTYLGKGQTFGTGTSMCTVVYRFPKGPIVATGLVARGALVFVLTITGGSGYYTGVGGTITSNAVRPGRNKLYFQLTP